MIIVEGLDNSGKSTLAAYLSAELGLPIHHPGGNPKSKEEVIERANFALDNHDKYIFDRTPFITEAVYCVLRNEDSWLADQKELYARFENLQPVLIYCRPPDNYVLDMRKHGLKDYDTPEYIEQLTTKHRSLLRIYDMLMRKLPCIAYDYTSDAPQNLLKRVKYESVRMDDYKNQKSSTDDNPTEKVFS